MNMNRVRVHHGIAVRHIEEKYGAVLLSKRWI